MLVCAIFIAAAALLVSCSAAPPMHDFDTSSVFLSSDPVSFAPLRPWLSPSFFSEAPEPHDSMHDWFSFALSSIKAWALLLKSQLADIRPYATHRSNERSDLPDLYWRFIPIFQAAVSPGSNSYWNTSCWARVTASAAKAEAGLTITFSASDRIGPFDCRDSYLLATVEGFHFFEVASDRLHTIHWSLENATAADLTWVARNGVRVFRFMDDISLTVDELLHTVELFEPEISKSGQIGDSVLEANLKFLRDYANVDMPRRAQNLVHVAKDDIKSGDFLAIIRISGLETMQVWGTGARTGHTAVAMWDEAGELWVMESTDKTNYWPNPNIQKTKWDEWIAMSIRAQYNVVLLPLSDESRSKFNVSAALDYFRSVEGVPYGYHNFIWGWVDTEQGNWPGPLSHQLVEVGFALTERVNAIVAKRMWVDAFNKRLNNTFDGTVAAYNAAASAGISFGDLISMVELDSWVYDDGPSMVCDVFACLMYKAGGLFGDLKDQVQCTEMQNWDVEVIAFFNTSKSAQLPQCAAADPSLTYCQLMGTHLLTIPGYGTVKPYPGMRNHCPALAPLFQRPDGC
jgi:hypothetical protein